jgi:hypothetical protein
MRHGTGVKSLANGNIYNGAWLYDNQNGKAKVTHTNGNIFEGDYYDNFKLKGVMHFANGDKYQGFYDKDKMHGHG